LGQDEIDEGKPLLVLRTAPIGDELVLPVTRVGKPNPKQLLGTPSEAVTTRCGTVCDPAEERRF
jgi:hypothetical protein